MLRWGQGGVGNGPKWNMVRIIRNLREDADKTQTEIAEILGTSQTMYARYERGASENAHPAFNKLYRDYYQCFL